MAFSLFSVVSLSVIYRLTINFPELPYTNELKNVESEDFVSTSKDIVDAIQNLVNDLDGQHTARVVDYRYHKVIGTLVYIDVYCEKESPSVSDVLLSAIKKGQIGNFDVSDEGFELHVVRDAETSCATTEFTCLDKTCIPADQRCDGRRDCPDGSDEHKDHGKCKQHQPIIYQTEKVVFTPKHGIIHLSAAVDHSEEHYQIAWSKDGLLLGIGSVTVTTDSRVQVYQKGEKHFLRITNATEKDDGTYKMIIQGMNVEADFEVRITSDRVAVESDDCPSGEKACRSGHCLPVSEFCDRRVQCPDGDDEEGCSVIHCKSNEFRCESTNICVPTVVICDGWRDCHDGSDEKNCSTSKKIYKPHHVAHAKLNVLCEDGSEPKFSLHGSSYCWSNSVCPSMSECVHGLCCPIAKTKKRQTSSCQADQFHCSSGECIENEKKCNRKYDCADGSDETTCEYYLAVLKYHSAQQKQDQAQAQTQLTQLQESREEHPHQHQAQQHHQQHQTQHHQQHQQHQSQAQPEASSSATEFIPCSDQEFRCPYLSETKCFHYDKLCDGNDDCGDGSDETNCDSNEDDVPPAETPATLPPVPGHALSSSSAECTSDQFQCKRGDKCIDRALECNRKYDCEDGSDETECEYFKSAMAARRASEETSTAARPVAQQTHEAQPQQPQQHHQQQHHQQATEEHRRREEDQRRRQHEEELQRRRSEQERHGQQEQQHVQHQHQHHQQQQQQPQPHQLPPVTNHHQNHNQNNLNEAQEAASSEVTFHDEYDSDAVVGCLEHEFQCAIGECIDKRRVCDTRPDCLDSSDEQNCSERASPQQQRHPAQPPPIYQAPTLPPHAPSAQEPSQPNCE